MGTKKYVMRSVRYGVRMVVILGLAFWVLHLTGMLDTGGEPLYKVLFMTPKGGVLIGALILLAGIYPRWGFDTIRVEADMGLERDAIIKAMDAANYQPEEQSSEKIVFRAKSMKKKLFMQFDDAVTVTDGGEGYIEIEGARKEIGRIEARINAARGA